MMGKAKAQQRLIDNIDDEFAKVWTSPTVSRCVFCIYGCDKSIYISEFNILSVKKKFFFLLA